jgi:hypothetical protein
MTVDAASLNAAPAGATHEGPANRLLSFHRQLCMHTGVQSRLIPYFISSVIALLAAFAVAVFLCNLAHAALVAPREPLFALRMSTLFWILGTEATALAFACVYIRPPRLKLGLVLWFAATVVIYRLGLHWQGVHNLSGYTASLAHTFGLSSGVAIIVLNLLFSYLLVGSVGLLLWRCLSSSTTPLPHHSTTPFLKTSCYFCKGHIEFPAHAIGEKIHCPHCKMDITLKEPV